MRAGLCEHAGIAVSTLYRWKALFLKHKALWLGVLEDLAASQVSFLGGMDGTFLQEFYQAFRFSFLQRPRSGSTELPQKVQGKLSGFT